MQGYSGTYAINGTNFILSPTEGGWVDRNEIGIDGAGHPIYPGTRQFNLYWGLAHPNDVKQLIDAYNLASSTGTVVFDLPEWGADGYKFKSYSGCTLREPRIGNYFEGHISDVRVTILMIRA